MTKTFHLILIRPSRYDDDGYVVQWRLSANTSTNLSVLHALAGDCARRRVLGPDTDIVVETWDDQSGLPRVKKMITRIQKASAGGLLAIVGAMSVQFPRGADLARKFRAAGIPVIIGGFHVSGCFNMLPQLPPELKEMRDLGVSLFVGEAEGRLEQVLKDARGGRLKPVYDYSDAPADLTKNPPSPIPGNVEKRMAWLFDAVVTVEAGRGCPFNCSFCSVINVHGRTMRARPATDLVGFIRTAVRKGRTRFLITDDNLSRNPNWREILEGLARLREQEGLEFSLMLQTDIQQDRVPEFIPLAARAGCVQVFIGMESINPSALASVNKLHNTVEDYQKSFLAWKQKGVMVMAGYIVGFPTDTPQSVRKDIAAIKRLLPVDLLYPLILTPLPGSAYHTRLWEQGDALDPDLNRYSTLHAAAPHPHMSRETLEGLYREVFRRFYDDAHVVRIFRRHWALGGNIVDHLLPFIMITRNSFDFENVFPSEMGAIRLKSRKDRQPGRPVEPAVPFFLGRVRDTVVTQVKWVREHRRLMGLARKAEKLGPPVDDPALCGPEDLSDAS